MIFDVEREVKYYNADGETESEDSFSKAASKTKDVPLETYLDRN